MDSFSVASAKTALRQDLQAQRAALVQGPELVDGIEASLRDVVHRLNARTIAAYLSYGVEPETRGFIHWALSAGLDVLLPVSKPDGTLDWVSYDGSTTRDGIFGFAEPEGTAVELATADLIVLPALAVDHSGSRLGKGKGYYDRALADSAVTAPRVALVFDHEVFEQLPTDSHDQPVAAAATPSKVYWF